ncbi:MAG: S41 family peptidase [Schleiferiaceae bacterium]|nr:S41 family peptidase [Schleiferiaceae bacterium]MDR9441191.1 S41 family peptidase [Schleiferiaceae bacterium]
MKRVSLVLLLLPLLWLGCEKSWKERMRDDSPYHNFDLLWETIDQKYAYLELKDLRWDTVYWHFLPQIDQNMGDEALFAVLDSMLYLLRDGHVNLRSPFDLSRNWQWYLGYPDNFDAELVERQYLGADHRIAGGMRYTFLTDSIGYLRYSSFGTTIEEGQLRAVLRYFKNARGLIVDIRSNGGGSLSNAYRLARTFVQNTQPRLRRLYRTGRGANEFDRATGLRISKPEDPRGRFSKPVMVLQNRRSYSAANTFAALMSQQDSVQLLGDTTGGGGGLPIDYELPNGWYFRFSGTRELMPNGRDLELGIPPDIPVQQDSANSRQGRDRLIEAALARLR